MITYTTCASPLSTFQVSVDDDQSVDNLINDARTATAHPTVGWKFERLTTLPVASILIVVNLIMIGLVFLIPGQATAVFSV